MFVKRLAQRRATAARLKAYVSAPGASFLPARGFTQGESVTASALVGPRGHAAAGQHDLHRRPPARPPDRLRQGRLSQPPWPRPELRLPAPAPAAGRVRHHPHPHRHPRRHLPHPHRRLGAGGRDDHRRTRAARVVPSRPQGRRHRRDLQVRELRGASRCSTWWQGRISGELGVGFGSDEIVQLLLPADRAPSPPATATRPTSTKPRSHPRDPRSSPLTRSSTPTSPPSADPATASCRTRSCRRSTFRPGLVMFEWHADGHVALARLASTRRRRRGQPVGLLPRQLVSRRPVGRRQLHRLLPQHVGRLRDQPHQRSCRVAPRRRPPQLPDGRRHRFRLAARRPLAARPHPHDLR